MKIALPLALLLCAASAWAQDQQVGARTKAMGGSYTAFEDDPVSVWLNPAGIATQPDALSIAYQTYTIWEFEIGGNSVEEGPAEYAWTRPAIVPSYLGVTFQLGTPDNPHSVGFCFTAPFRMKLGYDTEPGDPAVLNNAFVDQEFYRLRVAYAHDFRFQAPGSEGFFTHLAVGLGLDVNITNWTLTEFKNLPGGGNATLSVNGEDMGFGGGLGLLLGLYDNTRNFKVNFGMAYQSKANYQFSLDIEPVPLSDWPNQFQVGVTFYFLEGLPLRITLDAQLIQWNKAVDTSSIPGRDDFQNVLNYSLGLEYGFKVGANTRLYPRAGVRLYDAPWDDEDELPAIGSSIVTIDTRDDKFTIVTLGVGLGWSSEAGKSRAVDIAVDVGGDAPGVALGFSMEF